MNSIFKDCFRNAIKGVDPVETESFVDAALGLTREDYITLIDCNCSLQSFRIAIGNRLEIAWNSVASVQKINLIEDEVISQGFYKKGGKGFKKGDPKPNKVIKKNKVKVGKDNRQVDHFFGIKKNTDDVWKLKNTDGVWKLYLESKCCLVFDTEKILASNEKVFQVKEALGADEGAYFVPVLDTIPAEVYSKYPSMKIYGVCDILNMMGNPFTSEEYFAYLKELKDEVIQDIKNSK